MSKAVKIRPQEGKSRDDQQECGAHFQADTQKTEHKPELLC